MESTSVGNCGLGVVETFRERSGAVYIINGKFAENCGGVMEGLRGMEFNGFFILGV